MSATVAMAVFSWQLVKVNRELVGITEEMKQATAESATATKQSATAAQESAAVAKQSIELARLSLNSNRPFLLIVEESLRHMAAAQSAHVHPCIEFAFKNCGKGPALISTIHARLAVTKLPE